MREQRLPTSFKLRKSAVEKLEKILEYHQNIVQQAIIGKDRLNKTDIIHGMIEQMYFEMVQDGQIKE